MHTSVIGLGLLAMLSVCHSVEELVSVGDRHVKVTDVGGVVVMYKGTNMTNGITVKVASVKELMADNSEIATVNGTNHSFTDFSTRTFTMASKSTMTFPGSSISVTKLSMSTDLEIDSSNNLTAKFSLEMYVFMADGTVQVDGSDVTVKGGDVQFHGMIEDWVFCGDNLTCNTGSANLTGTNLDIAMDIQGTMAAGLKPGQTMMYKLGERSTIRLSNKVMYDGSSTATTMAANFPALSTSGSDQHFTYRLAKFDDSGKYSSILSLGRDDVFFDNLELKILGQSGKMSYFDKTNETKKITIEFDNLKEIQEDGSDIKDNAHRFNTFANQDFDITQEGDTTFQNLKVRKTRFNTTLNNNAVLDVNTLFFLEDGPITNVNETYDMIAGSMKFSVSIKDWAFCTGEMCGKGPNAAVGKYLDFEIVIKGKGDKVEKKNSTDKAKGIKYDLGYGELTMSSVVTVDGTAVQMETGYPMFVKQGSKNIFRLRFPMFTTGIYYDPGVEMYSSGSDGGDGGDGGDNGNNGGSNAGNDVTASHVTWLTMIMFSVIKLIF